MAKVMLYAKPGSYTGEDGKEHKTVRFYVECGKSLIPVEPVYFKNKETGKDSQYVMRKEVLRSWADDLPEKEKAAVQDESTVQA